MTVGYKIIYFSIYKWPLKFSNNVQEKVMSDEKILELRGRCCFSQHLERSGAWGRLNWAKGSLQLLSVPWILSSLPTKNFCNVDMTRTQGTWDIGASAKKILSVGLGQRFQGVLGVLWHKMLKNHYCLFTNCISQQLSLELLLCVTHFCKCCEGIQLFLYMSSFLTGEFLESKPISYSPLNFSIHECTWCVYCTNALKMSAIGKFPFPCGLHSSYK